MNPIELLVDDALSLALGSFSSPNWGIYLDGTPVIQPASVYGNNVNSGMSDIQALASIVGGPNIAPATASTVDFEYAQDWPISNYPQEQGAFQSYDKVTLPFDVKVRLASGGSASARQGFLSTCFAISNSFSLFDVVTPEMTYTSCNVTHIDFRRAAERGATLIVVELWFKEIPVSASATFSNTQQPGEAGQQSLGNVQAQTPNSTVQQNIVPGSLY